ncbi:hypothetical protein K443DRAFT_686839, partial [Laccaria amethystina LaAM-08-1]
TSNARTDVKDGWPACTNSCGGPLARVSSGSPLSDLPQRFGPQLHQQFALMTTIHPNPTLHRLQIPLES